MPQSSILAWLGGNSVISPKTPVTETADKQSRGRDALPTPPSSSPMIDSTKTSKRNAQADSTPTKAWTNGAQKPSLPPNVTFHPCTKNDIPQLKRLHSLLLPLPFPETFYREIYTDGEVSKLTLLAFWNDNPTSISTTNPGRLIAAIRCRILSDPKENAPKDPPMLYLSTLALLSPYRSHGIATHLLDVVTKRAVNDHGVTSVGAHVWEVNSEALEWYRKRGFREVGRDEGYYRRLQPSGAVNVRRRVGVLDLVGD